MHKGGGLFRIGILAVLIVTLTVLGTAVNSRSEDKIQIGVVNSFSGGGADMGLAGRYGADIAVEEINAAGGVNGKKLELIYRDDEGSPQKGLSAVQELLLKNGLQVIMGVNLTHVANAVNKIINDQKVLFMIGATGRILINPSQYPYTFRFNFSTDQEAQVLVKYLVEKLKAKKIGIISDSSAFGQTGYESVMEALKPYNITPVAREKYNIGDIDMTVQLLRLKNAGAELVIAWGTGPDLVPVSTSFAKIGWRPPIGSGTGASQYSFMELAQRDVADKWVISFQKRFSYTKDKPVGPAVQKLIDKVKKKYGNAVKIYVPICGYWYDMIYYYAKAVESLKSQDPTKIKTYFEKTPYDGVITYYRFSPTKHDGFAMEDMTVAHALRGDAFQKERIEY